MNHLHKCLISRLALVTVLCAASAAKGDTVAPLGSCLAAHETLATGQLRHLEKTAATASDHLKIAAFYQGRADHLRALADAYNDAAAKLEQYPQPKNLAAPGTAVRYRNTALDYRKRADEDQRVSRAQIQLAQTTRDSASIK